MKTGEENQGSMRAQSPRQGRHRLRPICRVRPLRSLIHSYLRQLTQRVGSFHWRQVSWTIQGHRVSDIRGDWGWSPGQWITTICPRSILKTMMKCDGFSAFLHFSVSWCGVSNVLIFLFKPFGWGGAMARRPLSLICVCGLVLSYNYLAASAISLFLFQYELDCLD